MSEVPLYMKGTCRGKRRSRGVDSIKDVYSYICAGLIF